MRTFEQFITEAQDDMGLRHRLLSGQVPPDKVGVLTNRRLKRDELTKARETPTTSGASVKSTAPKTLPGTASNYKPQPVTKVNNDLGPNPVKKAPIPNHLALSTKVKNPELTKVQQQRDKILGKNSNKSDVKFRKDLGNLTKGILKKGLTSQNPNVQIQQGQALTGPQKFGPETR